MSFRARVVKEKGRDVAVTALRYYPDSFANAYADTYTYAAAAAPVALAITVRMVPARSSAENLATYASAPTPLT